MTCPGCGKRIRGKPGTAIVCQCYCPGTKEFKAREAREAQRPVSRSVERRIRAMKGLSPVPEVHYRLIQDEDCHWYVIRTTQEEEFNQWQDAMAGAIDWDGFDFNEVRVNGPHTITFPEWKEEP